MPFVSTTAVAVVVDDDYSSLTTTCHYRRRVGRVQHQHRSVAVGDLDS